MKQSHVLILCGLLLTLSVSVTSWYFSWFSITTITCVENSQECSPSNQEWAQSFLGQSLFSVSPLLQPTSPFEVTKITKQLPNTLTIEIAAHDTRQPNGTLPDHQYDFTKKPDQEIDTLREYFEGEGIAVKDIEYQAQTELVIVSFPDEKRALLSSTNTALEAQKLAIIKNHLDLDEIETSIVEIDTRYTLPVLRVSYSEV